jgi:hypothetical protein
MSHYRDQIIKHRDLAHELKQEALQQIRAQGLQHLSSSLSLRSREIDEQADKAYKELLLAYKMTSFEDGLHEYTVVERNLENARKRIVGFPQRRVHPFAQRLPEMLLELLDRFYETRRPNVVEAMRPEISARGDPHAWVGEDHGKQSVNGEGSRPATRYNPHTHTHTHTRTHTQTHTHTHTHIHTHIHTHKHTHKHTQRLERPRVPDASHARLPFRLSCGIAIAII